MKERNTWRIMLAEEMKDHSDNGPVLKVSPSDEVLDVEFYDGYGGAEGPAFTAWTQQRVYFPIVYDGSEWIGSAPRNPCDEALQHQGGG